MHFQGVLPSGEGKYRRSSIGAPQEFGSLAIDLAIICVQALANLFVPTRPPHGVF